MGCVYAFWTPLRWQTAIWAVIYYFWTGLGITAGYHRLWAHKSYNASIPLKIFLAAVGGGAVEGSIRWWSRDHRAHHRYTDTTKDPYSVRKGLLYSHFGWMLMKAAQELHQGRLLHGSHVPDPRCWTRLG
jgi:stearoyl-CoA desaturase (delta-9 desaturase)